MQKTTVVELPRNPALAEPAYPNPDCALFELALAEVLRRDQLPPEASRHLASCEACSAMLHDFETIAGQVRVLAPLTPAETEAVPDQWPQIRAALLHEGIIHERPEDCNATTRAVPKLVPRDSADSHS